MGFWEWMGFENPRDSPKTEQPKEGLPQVTDNVRDSGQTFVFGRSNAGEQVDEKAAMQIPTVYACVRLLAESIAALPLHLYRVTDDKQVAITNAEAEAQKTSIAAEAQAEANRKLAESLSDTLIEYQKIQKWDGKLPTVSGGNALVSIDPAE